MYIYYIDFTYTPKLHRHWHIHPDTFPSACSLYALLVTHHYKLSAVWMVKSSCCWSIAVLPLKNRWNIILKICKCARVQINITHILHRYRYIYIYMYIIFGFQPPFLASQQGGWSLVHGPVGVAEWLQVRWRNLEPFFVFFENDSYCTLW